MNLLSIVKSKFLPDFVIMMSSLLIAIFILNHNAKLGFKKEKYFQEIDMQQS